MLTVGQVPVEALSVTVLDDRRQPADLSGYTAFDLLLTSPEGVPVNTSAGVTSVVGGKIKYAWPATSLFATPGDYTLRLKASKGAAVDYSDPAVIEVRRNVQP